MAPNYMNSQYDPNEVNYVTNDQVKAQNDYAKALMTGSGQQKVGHWTQGLSNMVASLMGGRMMHDVNEKRRQFNLGNAESEKQRIFQGDQGGGPAAPPTLGAAPPPPVSAEAPAPQAPTMGSAPSPSLGPSAEAADSPFLGFATAPLKQQLATDPALKNELMRRASAEDPKNPEVGMRTIFNRYLARKAEYDKRGGFAAAVMDHKYFPGQSLRGAPYKPEPYQAALDSATAGANPAEYATGNASQNVGFGYGHGAADPYTLKTNSGERYGIENDQRDKNFASAASDFDSKMPSQTDSVVRALNPTNDKNLVTDAAKQGVQFAENMAKTPGATPQAPQNFQMPGPNDQPYIDPAFLPKRRELSPQQYKMMLLDEGMNPNARNISLGETMQHGQPGTAALDGGTVTFDPNNPSHQRWDGPPPEGVMLGAGEGVNVPSFRRLTREPGIKGKVGTELLTPPRGGQAPPPDEGPAPFQKATAPSMMDAQPPQGAAGAASPDYVPPLAGPIPDTSGGQPKPPPIVPPAPPPSPTQGAGGAGGIDDWVNWAQQNKAKGEQLTEGAKKFNELHGSIHQNAEVAHDTRDQLEFLDALNKDPDLVSGAGASMRSSWRNLLNTMGFEGQNPTANQIFDKLKAGNILQDVRSKLGGQGLGQVRLAEIMLVAMSNVDASMTPGARQAIIDMAKSASNRLINEQILAENVRKGYRMDDKGNWKKEKSEGAPTASELHSQAAIFMRQPQNALSPQMATPESAQKYIDQLKKQGAPQPPPPGQPKPGFMAPPQYKVVPQPSNLPPVP